MKTTIIFYAIALSMLVLTSFSVHDREFEFETKNKEKLYSKEEFEEEIAFKESSNVLDTINPFGYIGLYQFGSSALKDLDVSKKRLLKMNKEEQIILFWRHAKKNKKYLEKKMDMSFERISKIWGISSGALIYMMHRHGSGSLEKFLKHGIDHADGNDKKISEIPDILKNYEFSF